MSNCLACGKPCTPGYSTCSSECVIKWREGLGEAPESDLTVQQLADHYEVTCPSVYGWINRGVIVPSGRDRRGFRFNLAECEKRLAGRKATRRIELKPMTKDTCSQCFMTRGEHVNGCPNGKPREPEPSEPPVIPLPARSEPVPAIHTGMFDTIRRSAIKDAREAYRDCILSAADDAEKAGEVQLQILLLKDYVNAEESFKVHFETN